MESNACLPSCFPTQENRPTENGVNTVASFTRCGSVVHRAGMNSSPRGNVLGSEGSRGLVSHLPAAHGSWHCLLEYT